MGREQGGRNNPETVGLKPSTVTRRHGDTQHGTGHGVAEAHVCGDSSVGTARGVGGWVEAEMGGTGTTVIA